MITSFLILFVKFLMFYTILSLTGRGFLALLLKKLDSFSIDEVSILGIPLIFFYPVFGVIFIGNFLFLFNFLLPIKNPFVYLFLFINIFNFKYKVSGLLFKKQLYCLLPFLVLLVTAYNINFHYDSGLYHLLNQIWIRESNLVIGFSNIYGALGVSSIFEYISALLWIDDTFILLHFLNLLFIGFFYQIIFYLIFINTEIRLKNTGILLLLFSLLDNFGFSGGKNGFLYIQGVGKQDVTLGILFLFVSIIIIHLIANNQFLINELILISFLVLFILQLKVSGFPIIFIYTFYLIDFLRKNSSDLYTVFRNLFPVGVLAIIWVIKSILQTGCLIFPLTSSCFNKLSWVNLEYIKIIEEVSVQYSISYNFGESLPLWISNYSENLINRHTILNFAISSFIILLFIRKSSKNINSSSLNLKLIAYIIFTLMFYLNFGPDTRYLIGIEMFIISVLGLYTYKPIINYKYLLYFGIFVSLMLVPRFNDYKNLNSSPQSELEIFQPELNEVNGRFIPKKGDQCWAELNCSSGLHSYKIIDDGFFKIVKLD